MARILIADDEKSIRLVLRKYLQSQGHEIVEAENGQKAYEILKSSPVDVAFVDIKMPGKSGLEILDEVKDIPIVILTAYGTMDYTVSAMEKGAVDYITKPFSFEEIKEILEDILAELEINIRIGKANIDIFRDFFLRSEIPCRSSADMPGIYPYRRNSSSSVRPATAAGVDP